MARGRKASLHLVLSHTERETLARWQRSSTLAAWPARRGRSVLPLAAGLSQSHVGQIVGVQRSIVRKWAKRFLAQRLAGPADAPGRGALGFFPPEVAIHVARLACARPETLGRRLSPWDGPALARPRLAEGIVAAIAAATVRPIVRAHLLQPWRHQLWRHPKTPRDAAVSATVSELIELYTRPQRADEMGLSVAEKTSLQPRPRRSPTRPAQPQNLPNRCAHAYKCARALTLFAAVDPRSAKGYEPCDHRKRQ
jgi:hypothetical protein